jgi:hypothetical protein
MPPKGEKPISLMSTMEILSLRTVPSDTVTKPSPGPRGLSTASAPRTSDTLYKIRVFTFKPLAPILKNATSIDARDPLQLSDEAIGAAGILRP